MSELKLLTPDELAKLTGKAWSRHQSAWLVEQGIPHRMDGKRVLVSHRHVDQWLEGRSMVRSQGLNLAAIR
jgi:hypothetical protein